MILSYEEIVTLTPTEKKVLSDAAHIYGLFEVLSLSKYLRNRHALKFLHFQIPSYLKDQQIDLVILKPQSQGQFKIKFCYKVKEEPKVETSKVLGIDLGTNNLAACVSSDGDVFLFSGKKLKSQNQFYNKKSAELQSKIDLEKHVLKKMKLKDQKTSLTKKRSRRIKDTLHKVSKEKTFSVWEKSLASSFIPVLAQLIEARKAQYGLV